MAVEYFTFPGNGEVVQAVFNGVAMISGSTMMGGAMQAAALFGFLVALSVAVFKLDLRESFTYLFVVGFFWMGMIVPKTTVLITESGGYGYTGRQYTVGNVPVGLAYMGYFVSSFGQSITRKAEQVNHLPDDLNYSRTGMLFGTRLLENIREARIPDAQLTQDWALFMNQCSFFDMNLYHFYNVQDLAQSADILATLTHTNQALFTNVSQIASRRGNMLQYNGKSKTMTCNEAAKELKDRTQFYSKNYLPGYIADRVFAGLGTNAAGINRVNALVTLGNSSFQYLLDNARFDTLKNIEQAAMVEVIRQAGIINGQRNRNSAAVQQAFAQVQARNQYIAAQKTGSSMASWNLPLIRSAAEAIMIGLFPFVMILALLGGIMAFRMLGFYMMGMMWIQLWAPVASIINLIMTMNTKRLLSLETLNGAITPGSSDTLLMAAADAQAAAGSAMWLIPVIAGALTMGGRSLMNGMMGMTSSAKSTGEAAGSQVGSGNYSAGNMNYNNSNANKHSLNPVYTDPQMMTAQSAAGTSWRNMATGENRYQGRGDSFGNVSSTSTVSMSDVYTQAADRSTTAAKQYAASSVEQTTLGNTQTLAFGLQTVSQNGANYAVTNGMSSSTAKALDQIFQSSKDIAQRNGLGNDVQTASSIALDLGAKLAGEATTPYASATVSGGVKAEGRGGSTNKLSHDISETAKALKSQGVSITRSMLENIGQSNAFTQALTDSSSLASQAQASYNKAHQASISEQQSYNEAQNYREAASRTAQSGATVSIDNAKAIREYADQNGLAYSQVYNNPSIVAAAAMNAAVTQASNLRQQAEGTRFDSTGPISPDDRPTNNVAAAYSSYKSGIDGQKSSTFATIQAQADRNGVNRNEARANIDGWQQKLEQGSKDAKNFNQKLFDKGMKKQEENTNKLHAQGEDTFKHVNTFAMGATQTFSSDKAYVQAQNKYGKTEGRPGSGSRNSRPKK
ncbi:TPA: conjugal transfer protein TraG N-terminal domain-containing protein [Neisseria meningitidis]|uniref:conjugal transfer protein TraG N-terminal domain-containing protein n=1 Tax=Neisseria meningitidis TaxID=487 RepID=UPI000CF6849B|nr:conjugal transfer protein TraG N-terminal domain-containing protein [Neisseria meningitidis]AVI44784.1 conjugal transfer protein TraG [Neisseria meningitidis]